MRKLILFNMMTADGYFEGHNEDISWGRVDKEVNEFITEQMKTGDTLLFGRKTFEVMENFWPTDKAFEQDPVIAPMMSSFTKVVFSTTRKNSRWENTKWFKANVLEEVVKLKEQKGKNMFVFGSADLCKTVIKHNLIDEFRLMIHPLTLGKGKLFFYTKMDFELLKTKVFGNGNVLLFYRPIKETNLKKS
ncbi:MAG: dihydrofolate reductase family protein [Ginsengibacter sp.]